VVEAGIGTGSDRVGVGPGGAGRLEPAGAAETAMPPLAWPNVSSLSAWRQWSSWEPAGRPASCQI
jgi:hypothetical protein